MFDRFPRILFKSSVCIPELQIVNTICAQYCLNFKPGFPPRQELTLPLPESQSNAELDQLKWFYSLNLSSTMWNFPVSMLFVPVYMDITEVPFQPLPQKESHTEYSLVPICSIGEHVSIEPLYKQLWRKWPLPIHTHTYTQMLCTYLNHKKHSDLPPSHNGKRGEFHLIQGCATLIHDLQLLPDGAIRSICVKPKSLQSQVVK